jgi:toxin YoeB
MHKITFSKRAENDLDILSKGDPKSYKKCFDLIRSTMIDPRNGIGKPEQLKHGNTDEYEAWSRRVNDKDRMIYMIYSMEDWVQVMSFKGHYDDK